MSASYTSSDTSSNLNLNLNSTIGSNSASNTNKKDVSYTNFLLSMIGGIGGGIRKIILDSEKVKIKFLFFLFFA